MDTSKYETTLPYPHKISPMDEGVKYFVKNYPDRFSPDMDHKTIWRTARKIYNEQVAVLERQFKTDALEEVGLAGHPKAEAAWEMAWDRGHSSGLYSVFQELEELAELLL